ncbi:MAG: homoserine kinase [Magnetococcales bacterium]|nr:homoserine kinase [Magnetococcales bacterium]
MSVYTSLSMADIQPLLQDYAIGQPLRLEGISAGVDNSNFYLTTDQGRFVLTLVEDPDQAAAVDHLLRLTTYLADRCIPAPRPIADRHGQTHHALRGRPVLLVTHLPGIHLEAPTPDHCARVGALLGRIHLAGEGFPDPRPNPMGPVAWHALFKRMQPLLERDEPTMARLIANELATLDNGFFRSALPSGVCHGDLFPDNVLFVEQGPVGVIDFHYACRERWLYDLAIALVAWGFDPAGRFLPDHFQAMVTGYHAVRALTMQEISLENEALRAASLRFLLTRLRDRLFPRSGAQTTRKSPDPFLKRLLFCQNDRV